MREDKNKCVCGYSWINIYKYLLSTGNRYFNTCLLISSDTNIILSIPVDIRYPQKIKIKSNLYFIKLNLIKIKI